MKKINQKNNHQDKLNELLSTRIVAIEMTIKDIFPWAGALLTLKHEQSAESLKNFSSDEKKKTYSDRKTSTKKCRPRSKKNTP